MRKASGDALLAAFVEELVRLRRSQGYQEQARLVIPRFFVFLRRRRIGDVRRVTEAHLAAYARKLAGEKTRFGTLLSVSTRAVHLGVLRRFFAFLERRTILLRNPARELSVPRPDRLPRAVLSETRARELVEAPPPHTASGLRDRALLEVLYGAGLRLGECARLDISDVDLAQRQLLVRDGKGRKDRVVPLPWRGATAVTAYLREVRPGWVHDPNEPALFLSQHGTRWKPGSIYIMVKCYARSLGLLASPHALRHACATHLLDGGANVRHVQALLGHGHLETTAIYTRVSMAGLRAAVTRAHPREGRSGRLRYRRGERS